MRIDPAALAGVVRDLAMEYILYDSTSISYERAQQLAEAVMYCIGTLADANLPAGELDAAKAYALGRRAVDLRG